ncbi:hypothetical protein OG417_30525 [Actinoallomurus sp. NBC_01490]|nr:hypothetical protein [Actinoallomurus sp. NBC_01490]
MTERERADRKRGRMAHLPDEGGPMTERSEGIEDTAAWRISPTKEGP